MLGVANTCSIVRACVSVAAGAAMTNRHELLVLLVEVDALWQSTRTLTCPACRVDLHLVAAKQVEHWPWCLRERVREAVDRAQRDER